MSAYKTTTFKSGNSEAVRLPKGIGFGPGTAVVIHRDGDVVTVRPALRTLAEMVAALEALPSPDGIEVRDEDEIPEPAGL